MSAARRACGGFCQIALLALAWACRLRADFWTGEAEARVRRAGRWSRWAAALSAKAEDMAR